MKIIQILLLVLIIPTTYSDVDGLYERSAGWDSYDLHEEAVKTLLLKEADAAAWILIWDSYARTSNPLEISISILESQRPKVVVEIAKEKTLMMQLLGQAYTTSKKKAEDKISRKDALSSLETEKHKFFVSECNGLAQIIEKLEQIDISLPSININECPDNAQPCFEEYTVYLHSRVYEIEFEKHQKVSKFTYWGGYDALSSWAEEVRSTVLRCI